VEGDDDDDDDDDDMPDTHKPLNDSQGLASQSPNPLPPVIKLALNRPRPVKTQKALDIPIFFEEINVLAEGNDKDEVMARACRACK
jgi:hypothetical protein